MLRKRLATLRVRRRGVLAGKKGSAAIMRVDFDVEALGTPSIAGRAMFWLQPQPFRSPGLAGRLEHARSRGPRRWACQSARFNEPGVVSWTKGTVPLQLLIAAKAPMRGQAGRQARSPVLSLPRLIFAM